MADVDFDIECWYQKYCGVRDIEPDMPDYPKCKKACPMYLGMNFLMQNCGMPDAYPYMIDLEPYEDDDLAFKRLFDIKEHIDEYVNNGKNLYISSLYQSSGKTTWSLKIMYRYFDKIWVGNGFNIRGYFLYVPRFLRKMKNFSYRDTREFKEIDYALEHADLIIWDDITSKNLTESEMDLLDSYISERYMKKKSNIFNGKEVKDLKICLGESLAGRLEKCEHILIREDYSEEE